MTSPLASARWALAALCSLAQAEPVVYVNDDAVGSNDGSCWTDAFADLQTALSVALAGDEVWVAEGTYKPAAPGGEREAAFELPPCVMLLGGFAGSAEQPEQRDPTAYPTILSGDLNGDDGPDFLNNADNSFHVVTAGPLCADCGLDGFTVSGGNAAANGGGLLCDYGCPAIVNCVFQENFSSFNGGAVYIIGSAPVMVNCRFEGNLSTMNGGAIASLFSGATLIASTFVNNASMAHNGGGFYDQFGAPTLINCAFYGNTANGTVGDGAGAFSLGGTPNFINCLFSGNISLGANSEGGGLQNNFADATVTNCTFSRNVGTRGGGIYNYNSTAVVNNCLFWDNTDSSGSGEAGQMDGVDSQVTVDYTSLQGWTGQWSGIGNNGDDPLFVDPDGLDDLPGTEDDDLRPSPVSPAIDSGNNLTVPPDALDLDEDGDTVESVPIDLDGRPRFVDDPNTPDNGAGSAPFIDRGAYEFQPSFRPCQGDANGDGTVDPLDSGFALARLGCLVGAGDPDCDAADQNGDGVVDPLDAGYVLARFGECD